MLAVDLGQLDVHPFFEGRRNVLPYVIRLDRELTMAPIYQHREFHCCWPAQVGEGIERGPDGSPGVKHVVDQNHRSITGVNREDGPAEHGSGALAEVVAIEANVEITHRDLVVFDGGNGLGQSFSQGPTAGVNPDQDQTIGAVVALADLVRDPFQGSADLVVGQKLGGSQGFSPFRPHRTGLKGCGSRR